MTLHHCHSCNPHYNRLFDSSVDPALLAGMDDTDDEDTSFVGVYDEDTSFAGVPVPNTTILTKANDNLDAESNHKSIDPKKADNNSSKASIHCTGSHLFIHSATSEPPQHPLDDKDNLSEDQTKPDDVELPELETQVPILCQSARVSVPPSDYIPQMGVKTYVTNIQTETNQDEENGLVYNHDEARVLVTVITPFNKHMEHVVEEHRQQHVVTYSLKAGINKFGDQAKASAHEEMKQLHNRSCFRPVYKCLLNKFKKQRPMESLLLLTEKRDKMIKSQHCANGSSQCTYMQHDEVMSPTISMEGTLLTAVIEAQEG